MIFIVFLIFFLSFVFCLSCFSFGLTELVVMVVVRGFGDVRVMEKRRSLGLGF